MKKPRLERGEGREVLKVALVIFGFFGKGVGSMEVVYKAFGEIKRDDDEVADAEDNE